ncbi:unnamed protein product [Boreogadus saida]
MELTVMRPGSLQVYVIKHTMQFMKKVPESVVVSAALQQKKDNWSFSLWRSSTGESFVVALPVLLSALASCESCLHCTHRGWGWGGNMSKASFVTVDSFDCDLLNLDFSQAFRLLVIQVWRHKILILSSGQ